MKTLRIATRQSPLALWQAEHVAELLKSAGYATELVPLVSGGDTDMRPIDGTRQVGVFTKRIQLALLDDEADVAVHSLKDLPTEVDSRLTLAAVPERETIDDSLVSKRGWNLDQLPAEARVGTGSKRRAAQLLSVRPDLDVQPIRGNVQTRLSKLDSGEYDAIILAEAGIIRLEMHDLPRTRLPRHVMLPAPGQGALGIEVRAEDAEAVEAVKKLDHLPSRVAVIAERALLAALHGGCLAPIAAHAELRNGHLTLASVVLSSDGTKRINREGDIAIGDAVSEQQARDLAHQIVEQLQQEGAAELIEQSR